MLSAPFTLCVRGNGNFSVRFYETLAFGRIPVLFNSDCVLPLEKSISWSKHCILVDDTDPKTFAETVELKIKAMSYEEIIEMQIANRKLWIEALSFGGFYNSFVNQIIKKK